MDRTIKVTLCLMAAVIILLCVVGLASSIHAHLGSPWWLAAVLACALEGALINLVIGYAMFSSRVERNDGITGGNA